MGKLYRELPGLQGRKALIGHDSLYILPSSHANTLNRPLKICHWVCTWAPAPVAQGSTSTAAFVRRRLAHPAGETCKSSAGQEWCQPWILSRVPSESVLVPCRRGVRGARDSRAQAGRLVHGHDTTGQTSTLIGGDSYRVLASTERKKKVVSEARGADEMPSLSLAEGRWTDAWSRSGCQHTPHQLYDSPKVVSSPRRAVALIAGRIYSMRFHRSLSRCCLLAPC